MVALWIACLPPLWSGLCLSLSWGFCVVFLWALSTLGFTRIPPNEECWSFSCYKTRDKCWPDGPLSSYVDFTMGWAGEGRLH